MAVVSLACALAGLLIPLANLAGIVLGVVALLRIRRSEPRQQGAGFAIVGIVVGAFGVVTNLMVAVIIVSATQAVQTLRTPSPEIVAIQQRLFAYEATTGAYPDHVARLLIDGPDSRVHEMALNGLPIRRQGTVVAGSYDLIDFDGSPKSVQLLERGIGEVIAQPGGFYSFGHCWFMRLPERYGDDDLVAAWCLKGPTLVFVFDSGRTMTITDETTWDQIWDADETARESLEIEQLPTRPAFPFGL